MSFNSSRWLLDVEAAHKLGELLVGLLRVVVQPGLVFSCKLRCNAMNQSTFVFHHVKSPSAFFILSLWRIIGPRQREAKVPPAHRFRS